MEIQTHHTGIEGMEGTTGLHSLIPFAGTFLSITLGILGYFIDTIIVIQLPPIVMQLAQLAVWGLAAAVSIVTLFWVQERRKELKNSKKNHKKE